MPNGSEPAQRGDTKKRLQLELPAPMPRGRRKLVIRGDLRSTTGYGHETRALAMLLRARFELFGVDLHHNPVDDEAPFPGRLIDDDAVAAMCTRGEQPFILNNTTPETFAYFHDATNIGAFYWETDPLPLKRRWPEMICAMDYIWAKTHFDRGLIQQSGFARDVPIVTWPFDFNANEGTPSPALDDLNAYMIDRMGPGDEPPLQPLRTVRQHADNLFLSVKSLAPRKGLPVLLSEWRDYIQQSNANDVLFLKLKFVHNDRLEDKPIREIEAMLGRAGFQEGDRVSIAFTADDLTQRQLSALYHLSDAYLSTSYGEGFGGPLIESLLAHRPVIAARHTAAIDLLAEDNPFLFESKRLHVGLRGNSPIYPNAASWHVPARGSVVQALQRFARLSPAARIEVTRSARRHAEAFCARPVVQRQIDKFFDQADQP